MRQKKKSEGKNPAFLLYGMDFMRDMAPHPPEIRGVWISVMCTVCFSKIPGTATMTLEQWSRIFGTSIEKTTEYLAYLKFEKIGDISDVTGREDERITITSRRMVRDAKLSEIRRKCGKLGWKIKSDLLTQNSSKKNLDLYQKHETETEKEKESFKGKGGVGGKDDKFEIFWKAYPKKKSKGQAEKVWSRIKPNEQLLAIMLAKIEQAKTSVEWTKDGGQFIPYPATWLNAKGWEDVFDDSGNIYDDRSFAGAKIWLEATEAQDGKKGQGQFRGTDAKNEGVVTLPDSTNTQRGGHQD